MIEGDAGTGPIGASFLDRAVIALSAMTAAATALELAFERHWHGFEQLLPLGFLGGLSVAIALLVVRPSPPTVRLAQALAVLSLGGAAFGIYEHIDANHSAGALDFRYSDTWDSISGVERWWKAATKDVGPAPILAPGALGQTALLVLIVTVRHPASRGR